MIDKLCANADKNKQTSNLVPRVRFSLRQHQELGLWPLLIYAHKLEVARDPVLGADQKKSGLGGRDCTATFIGSVSIVLRINPETEFLL